MKLIKILALATAMATMATAQNSSANGQNSGGAKPSPTATPAAATSKDAKTKTGSKTPAATTAAKPGTATPAKATNSQASSAKPAPAAKGGTAPGSAKVAVKTSSAPVKDKSAATSQPAGPVVKVKATPTPAVPAKAATAAKTDAKRPDVKKPPAVIAVKPTTGTKAKKTGAAQAKAPAKTPPPTVTQVGTPAKPAEKPKPVTRAFGAHGRRDPFVSPIRIGGSNTPVPNCTTGKRCLAIPELVLQGTIKDMTGKMMAVVANSTKHTYFLRENDQVFNGSVEKITSDSIIFREYVKDPMGRETAREVVKKLVPTS